MSADSCQGQRRCVVPLYALRYPVVRWFGKAAKHFHLTPRAAGAAYAVLMILLVIAAWRMAHVDAWFKGLLDAGSSASTNTAEKSERSESDHELTAVPVSATRPAVINVPLLGAVFVLKQ